VLVVDVGLLISGLIFFIMGIRKCVKYSIPKEERKLWE